METQSLQLLERLVSYKPQKVYHDHQVKSVIKITHITMTGTTNMEKWQKYYDTKQNEKGHCF